MAEVLGDTLHTTTNTAAGATDPIASVGTLVGGAVQQVFGGMIRRVQEFIDKWFPPEKRSEWYARLEKFANERPKLTAFLLSHIAISGPPLALFIALTITIATFAIIAALLVGLLGAVLFIVAAVGFALVFLLPTLFFTTMVATFVFLWGLAAYYIVLWFNEKKVPGIHTGLVEGLTQEFLDMTEPSEAAKLPSLYPDPSKAKPPPQQQAQQQDSHPDSSDAVNGSADKEQAAGTPKAGKPKKLPPQGQVQHHVDAVGKTTGIDVGGVTKTANSLKQGVAGGII